jgi:hypothetical protein
MKKVGEPQENPSLYSQLHNQEPSDGPWLSIQFPTGGHQTAPNEQTAQKPDGAWNYYYI